MDFIARKSDTPLEATNFVPTDLFTNQVFTPVINTNVPKTVLAAAITDIQTVLFPSIYNPTTAIVKSAHALHITALPVFNVTVTGHSVLINRAEFFHEGVHKWQINPTRASIFRQSKFLTHQETSNSVALNTQDIISEPRIAEFKRFNNAISWETMSALSTEKDYELKKFHLHPELNHNQIDQEILFNSDASNDNDKPNDLNLLKGSFISSMKRHVSTDSSNTKKVITVFTDVFVILGTDAQKEATIQEPIAAAALDYVNDVISESVYKTNIGVASDVMPDPSVSSFLLDKPLKTVEIVSKSAPSKSITTFLVNSNIVSNKSVHSDHFTSEMKKLKLDLGRKLTKKPKVVIIHTDRTQNQRRQTFPIQKEPPDKLQKANPWGTQVFSNEEKETAWNNDIIQIPDKPKLFEMQEVSFLPTPTNQTSDIRWINVFNVSPGIVRTPVQNNVPKSPPKLQISTAIGSKPEGDFQRILTETKRKTKIAHNISVVSDTELAPEHPNQAHIEKVRDDLVAEAILQGTHETSPIHIPNKKQKSSDVNPYPTFVSGSKIKTSKTGSAQHHAVIKPNHPTQEESVVHDLNRKLNVSSHGRNNFMPSLLLRETYPIGTMKELNTIKEIVTGYPVSISDNNALKLGLTAVKTHNLIFGNRKFADTNAINSANDNRVMANEASHHVNKTSMFMISNNKYPLVKQPETNANFDPSWQGREQKPINVVTVSAYPEPHIDQSAIHTNYPSETLNQINVVNTKVTAYPVFVPRNNVRFKSTPVVNMGVNENSLSNEPPWKLSNIDTVSVRTTQLNLVSKVQRNSRIPTSVSKESHGVQISQSRNQFGPPWTFASQERNTFGTDAFIPKTQRAHNTMNKIYPLNTINRILPAVSPDNNVDLSVINKLLSKQNPVLATNQSLSVLSRTLPFNISTNNGQGPTLIPQSQIGAGIPGAFNKKSDRAMIPNNKNSLTDFRSEDTVYSNPNPVMDLDQTVSARSRIPAFKWSYSGVENSNGIGPTLFPQSQVKAGIPDTFDNRKERVTIPNYKNQFADFRSRDNFLSNSNPVSALDQAVSAPSRAQAFKRAHFSVANNYSSGPIFFPQSQVKSRLPGIFNQQNDALTIPNSESQFAVFRSKHTVLSNPNPVLASGQSVSAHSRIIPIKRHHFNDIKSNAKGHVVYSNGRGPTSFPQSQVKSGITGTFDSRIDRHVQVPNYRNQYVQPWSFLLQKNIIPERVMVRTKHQRVKGNPPVNKSGYTKQFLMRTKHRTFKGDLPVNKYGYRKQFLMRTKHRTFKGNPSVNTYGYRKLFPISDDCYTVSQPLQTVTVSKNRFNSYYKKSPRFIRRRPKNMGFYSRTFSLRSRIGKFPLYRRFNMNSYRRYGTSILPYYKKASKFVFGCFNNIIDQLP